MLSHRSSSDTFYLRFVRQSRLRGWESPLPPERMEAARRSQHAGGAGGAPWRQKNIRIYAEIAATAPHFYFLLILTRRNYDVTKNTPARTVVS